MLPLATVAAPRDFSQVEDSLSALSSGFLDIRLNETEKQKRLEQFNTLLEETLSDPASMSYPFAKLSHVSILSPSDRSFRIFTWFTVSPTGYTPHGMVQVIHGKRPSCKVFPLLHNAEAVRSLSYKTLDADEWFGAVYYEMIEFKQQKKRSWILLGFNGNDGVVHKKVIDVITIGSNGTPKFGSSVFYNEDRMASRVIFQYSAKAKVSVRYDEKEKMIIFDHLAPQRPGLEEQYQHYVPDLSYDALKLAKGKWMYKKDVNARNEDENKGNEGTKYNITLPEHD